MKKTVYIVSYDSYVNIRISVYYLLIKIYYNYKTIIVLD